jgi:hypothetical protein
MLSKEQKLKIRKALFQFLLPCLLFLIVLWLLISFTVAKGNTRR